MRYITDNEIAIKNKDTALKMAEMLISEGYCVMLSREEQLYIINYVWTSSVESDRNEVIFLSREEFEDEFFASDEEKH
jgi:hypothetical protein